MMVAQKIAFQDTEFSLADDRPAFVTEFTAPVEAAANDSAPAPRPRLLARRIARWARRTARIA